MPSINGLLSLPEEITSSELFAAALTHRSFGQENNERLEFLGDAVLGLIIAKLLFEHFPSYDEGDLSRLRAHLVCKKKLAELAKQVGLGSFLRLGSCERKSGGHLRSSILADSLEAIIGAVYLLKGFIFAEEFVAQLYAESLQSLPLIDELKDAKTRLQEQMQSRQINVPEYIVVEEWGEGNNKSFKVECRVQELELSATGEGKSKKKAEQTAAQVMINSIKEL